MTTQMPDATSPFTLSEWQPEPRAGDDTDADRSSDDYGTWRRGGSGGLRRVARHRFRASWPARG